ncbi:uncharacterized protein KY384_006499 [Bacidia gigantensis]|uniref:uncharacterized protein n=1 Tax=Bacidia gigantensis TaxID=2732470 RepID=UPI001D058592|nr:uncharacterized protein KY384_006499 [Bacidia gigantensis]KAG8528810.1 hypothetical protein KY384_006499 [Bacidia gigantensis]
MDGLPTADTATSPDSESTPTAKHSGTSADAPISNGSLAQGDNKFQNAISAWRNIDLTNLVPELDAIATDVVAHQKDALLSRKELAQKTKDFRKLDDTAKLVEIKSLLKAYQSFIDNLTNHGKTAQSAFLRVYSSVSEAPDPYPLLEASVDSLLLSEDTLPKLTTENEHLQKNTSKLTEQLDISERQLEKERGSRRQLEDGRDAKIREIEASWKAVMDEKKDNWESKEQSLEDKVESQDRLLNELKASYEVAQRLEQGGEGSEEKRQNFASAAELEIVSSDLDRTAQRLAEIEARNEQLRTQLAEASSIVQKPHEPQENADVARLRSENSSLLRKLDALRLEKDSDSRKREGRVKSLEKDVQSAESDRDALRAKVNSWRDYTEIKQELEIFKSIEFSTLDDDPDGEHLDGNDQPNGVPKGGEKDSLEKLLLARNKKLSNEMAILRVSHQDLQLQLDSLEETLSRTNAELERAQNLNATLESDLVKVQQEASNAFPSNISSAGTYTSRYPTPSYNANSFPNRKGRSSPTSSIISGFDPSSTSRANMDAIRAGEPVGGGSGILPMIQAQRDRFKQKNGQLEEDLSKQYATVATLRQEVASLQKDNLNLYEKSRYISTYNRSQSTSASAYAQAPPASSISMSDTTSSGLSLDRYRSTYEANLSPFAAFRGRENTRAYKRLSLPERVIFSVTRMVLANRTSRNVFAFYCLALHLMIFVMLYWMHSVDVTNSASNLSATVAKVAGPLGAGDAGAKAGMGAEAAHGGWEQEGFIANPDD